MKRTIMITAAALAALIMLAGVSAAAEVAPLPADGIYAVVTGSDGSVSVDGAPEAEELADVEGYELIVQAHKALAVDKVIGGPKGVVGESPYFSVSFAVPGTAREIFLTGLGAEDIEELQTEIIDSILGGADFDIERLSFIDAEKTAEADADDQLCWAASTADILTYSGWGAQAGFDSEDDLFEALIAAFSNDGGNASRGMAWFFNGSAMGDNSGYDDGQSFSYILDYPNTGGFLRDYAFDMLSDYLSIYDSSDVADMFAHLRSGEAVSLGLTVYNRSSGSYNGHSVTLWGYCEDTSVPEGENSRYVSIFFSDSDSDELSGEDRENAPNVLSYHRLLWDNNGYPYFNYGRRSIGYLDEYTWLIPYSAELSRETSAEATRVKAADPDLAINGNYLSSRNGALEFSDLFESGMKLYLMAGVINASDVDYSGRITVRGVVTDSGGAQVREGSKTFSVGGGVLMANYYVNVKSFIEISALPAGDYTLTYEINPQRTVTEAYFYNNTHTVSFRVRDSYLLGDYDGSGTINILDVTTIQRSLAGYRTELGSVAGERGDVNGHGLDIMDANSIQRSLAGYQVGLPIGDKRLYN